MEIDRSPDDLPTFEIFQSVIQSDERLTYDGECIIQYEWSFEKSLQRLKKKCFGEHERIHTILEGVDVWNVERLTLFYHKQKCYWMKKVNRNRTTYEHGM